MFIGLISDTHAVFDKPFRDFFEPVDEIWHAGDWGGDEDFIKQITSFKPVRGVFGNCDGPQARYEFAKFQHFELEGMSFLMTHIGGSPDHYYTEARKLIEEFHPQVFICGHSHILRVVYDHSREMMYLNPGAAGHMGWQSIRSALRFKVEDGKLKEMEVLKLPI